MDDLELMGDDVKPQQNNDEMEIDFNSDFIDSPQKQQMKETKTDYFNLVDDYQIDQNDVSINKEEAAKEKAKNIAIQPETRSKIKTQLEDSKMIKAVQKSMEQVDEMQTAKFYETVKLDSPQKAVSNLNAIVPEIEDFDEQTNL